MRGFILINFSIYTVIVNNRYNFCLNAKTFKSITKKFTRINESIGHPIIILSFFADKKDFWHIYFPVVYDVSFYCISIFWEM